MGPVYGPMEVGTALAAGPLEGSEEGPAAVRSSMPIEAWCSVRCAGLATAGRHSRDEVSDARRHEHGCPNIGRT
jgi:hypothetical protein